MIAELIGLLLILTKTIVVVWIAILAFRKIVTWFRNRRRIVEQDRAKLAFSIQERLRTDDYRTVYGIFDQQTNEIVDAEKVDSDSIDPELYNVHRGKQMVVYR